MMKTLRSRLLAVFTLLVALAAPRAWADSALLTRNGVLYEVFATTYGTMLSADKDDKTPVLALRTTLPSGDSRLEVVAGTLDAHVAGTVNLEYEDESGTLFVLYTEYQGLMSDLHFAVHRDGKWVQRDIAPSIGLFLSLNPRLVVTRQHYVDVDGAAKSRAILSIVWWEESGASQARYAAVFVEDGALDLDSPGVVNLNDLVGSTGTTDPSGLPISSYEHPSVQRDPTTNGGILVSFANLVSRRHEVLRITFPDDLTKLDTTQGKTFARGHIPIGGRLTNNPIPSKIDTASNVGTMISPSGIPTFYWQETSGGALRYVRGDDEDGNVLLMPLRSDFNPDRAQIVLRGMVDKQ
jgi:hypothetical protein